MIAHESLPDQVPSDETASAYGEQVGLYLNQTETDSILRPHQRAVFEDIQTFLADGHTRGYVQLPTGTGKTVLFVKLAEALRNMPDGQIAPRILVVTPTKDLVYQTLGRTGEKGFGGFAKDLTVQPFFSDSSQDEKDTFTRADVGVTTYQSFNLLRTRRDLITPRELGSTALMDIYHNKVNSYLNGNGHYTQKGAVSMAQRYMNKNFRGLYEGAPMLDAFDLIILDEVHHALEGSAAAKVVHALPADKRVIGFTATPDASDERVLETILPKEIHSMQLREAVELGLLSPVVPIGVDSGIRVDGNDLYDASGEFIDSRLSQLAATPDRNRIIVDTAKTLAANKVGTIISCIAGNDAWQARYLADELEQDGVRAAAVYSRIPAHERAEIYRQFNAGELDVLTYVGVLGEGWDSARAKAIINARPTRSPIVAEQRLGRVTRPGGVAYAIDILDSFESDNQPITIVDVLRTETIRAGSAVGDLPKDNEVNAVLEQLQAMVSVKSELQNNYANYQQILSKVPRLTKGRVKLESGETYVLPSRISASYIGVSAEVLDRAAELTGRELQVMTTVRGRALQIAYSQEQALELLRDLPVVKLNKYHIDANKEKWIAPEGLLALFSKRYPQASLYVMKNALKQAADRLDWMPATTRHDRGWVGDAYTLVKLYHVSQQSVGVINAALAKHYKTEQSS